jgi:hypothetical protein
MAGCSVSRVIAGTPIAPPPPTHAQVEVSLALMDSFDVVSVAKCAGRRNNDGIYEGAIAEVRGMSDHRRFSLQQVTTATISTAYVQNDSDQSVDGDGTYCLARFTFVPLSRTPGSTASSSRQRRSLGPTPSCGPSTPMCVADAGTDHSTCGRKAAPTPMPHRSVYVRPSSMTTSKQASHNGFQI